jgi:hypothetical protein
MPGTSFLQLIGGGCAGRGAERRYVGIRSKK